MAKSIQSNANLRTDSTFVLLSLAICLYVLLILYHGFIAFGRDTIETVPYALWMADHRLFASDFHLSHLRSIFPNERWIIAWSLHFFAEQIKLASWVFHGIFSLTLLAGMLRVSDHILRNIEMAVLAVFICLFSLYNINIGSNELYYNMYVPSLAGKAVAVWALFYFLKEQYLQASVLLAMASFLHPLVGFQLFVIASAMLVWKVVFSKTEKKFSNVLKFIIPYLLTAGIWIVLLLGAQGPKELGEIPFFDIVRFRIAHHFFPAFFPLKSMILLGGLYVVSMYYYYVKKSLLQVFFYVSILGMIFYVVGLNAEVELVLSSQWMKVNIWLKFFGIIGFLELCQKLIEKRYIRVLTLILFLGALVIALLRFNPSWDKAPPTDLYAWISINSDTDDLFLVPPELVDFKARTWRSSYFDFKAMLHHQPAIYEWADRFTSVYGIEITDRKPADDIFMKVKNAYFSTEVLTKIPEVKYVIVKDDQLSEEREKALSSSWKLVFEGNSYMVYEQGE